ncbi:MAG: glycosyltransferase family 4 protein [Candidatus Omnitrophica bacterium]|nr:glycosyltransferase family 4 protein [Candidatus Omnitrophota bacterium]
MRVAFFVYPSAFQNKGGGEILLEKSEEYLKKTDGIEIKRFDMWQDRIEDFDILHVFGSVKDCLGIMLVAKARGVKVVLESIFWSDLRRAVFEEGGIISKAKMVTRHFAKVVCPFYPSARKKMFETADMIFPNSDSEARQISRFFNISMKKMFVVPNGVDMKFESASSGLFVEKFGIKDFVLYTGRIEPRKNQLNLIRAMKGLDKDLVLIGEQVSSYKWYYDKCIREAGENVHFLGKMDHGSEMLLSAYAACDVFVLPGWFETPGLAALEAALIGAKVVVTDGGSTKEYFQDKVLYIKPNNVKDMRRKIEIALEREKINGLKEFVLDSFIWEKVAERMVEGYKRVIEKNVF